MSSIYKREYDKQYYKDNIESKRQYRKDNVEKIKEWYKQYYKNNKEKVLEYATKRNYGLSHEDWLKIWETQNGECAICGEFFDKPSDAQVDHNHKTNEIRGLLCRKCNLGIGYFNDNLELMMRAIKYLNKREKRKNINGYKE